MITLWNECGRRQLNSTPISRNNKYASMRIRQINTAFNLIAAQRIQSWLTGLTLNERATDFGILECCFKLEAMIFWRRSKRLVTLEQHKTGHKTNGFHVRWIGKWVSDQRKYILVNETFSLVSEFQKLISIEASIYYNALNNFSSSTGCFHPMRDRESILLYALTLYSVCLCAGALFLRLLYF